MLSRWKMKYIRLREAYYDVWEICDACAWRMGRLDGRKDHEYPTRYQLLVQFSWALLRAAFQPHALRDRYSMRRLFRLIGRPGRRSTVKPRIRASRIGFNMHGVAAIENRLIAHHRDWKIRQRG